jgi:hypothetical protein
MILLLQSLTSIYEPLPAAPYIVASPARRPRSQPHPWADIANMICKFMTKLHIPVNFIDQIGILLYNLYLIIKDVRFPWLVRWLVRPTFLLN